MNLRTFPVRLWLLGWWIMTSMVSIAASAQQVDGTNAMEMHASHVDEFREAIVGVNGHQTTVEGVLKLQYPISFANRGGISGLEVAPDGQTFWAITDRGEWLEFQLEIKADQPIGFRKGRIRSPKHLKGTEPEALAVLSGHLFVSLEGTHSILRFPIQDGSVSFGDRPTTLNLPKAMLSKLPKKNEGLEALTALTGALVGVKDASLFNEDPIPMWIMKTTKNSITASNHGYTPVESIKENTWEARGRKRLEGESDRILFQRSIHVTGASNFGSEVYLLERTFWRDVTGETRARISKLVEKEKDEPTPDQDKQPPDRKRFTSESICVVRHLTDDWAIENLEAIVVFSRGNRLYALVASDDRCGRTPDIREPSRNTIQKEFRMHRSVLMIIRLDDLSTEYSP